VTTGAPKNFRFAKKRRLAVAFSSLAGLCPLLLLCAEFMIAPVPAAAQSIGFGGGRDRRAPAFMSHGGLGSAGWGAHGKSPSGQIMGQPRFHQRPPYGADGGEQRSHGHWPGHDQPSRLGTREVPARGGCGDGPCRATYPPWRGQGHPSKVGAMEVPPGRRPPQGNCDGAPCLPKKNAGSNEGQPPQGGGQKPPAPPAAGNCGGASVLSYTKAGGRLPCGGNSPVPPQLGKCDGRPCPRPAPVAGGGSVTPPPVWPGGACVGSSCAPRPTPHPWPLPVPPPVIGQTNLPPRGPIPPIMTQAGPPPPQAPKPPTHTNCPKT
jgi:hypothetical protein